MLKQDDPQGTEDFQGAVHRRVYSIEVRQFDKDDSYIETVFITAINMANLLTILPKAMPDSLNNITNINDMGAAYVY